MLKVVVLVNIRPGFGNQAYEQNLGLISQRRDSCSDRGSNDYSRFASWLNRGSDSHMSEVWIRCKRLILKLSEVLIIKKVRGRYIHPNQRLALVQKWYNLRDIQLARIRIDGRHFKDCLLVHTGLMFEYLKRF